MLFVLLRVAPGCSAPAPAPSLGSTAPALACSVCAVLAFRLFAVLALATLVLCSALSSYLPLLERASSTFKLVCSRCRSRIVKGTLLKSVVLEGIKVCLKQRYQELKHCVSSMNVQQ
jgi:hypothetical protein